MSRIEVELPPDQGGLPTASPASLGLGAKWKSAQ